MMSVWMNMYSSYYMFIVVAYASWGCDGGLDHTSRQVRLSAYACDVETIMCGLRVDVMGFVHKALRVCHRHG